MVRPLKRVVSRDLRVVSFIVMSAFGASACSADAVSKAPHQPAVQVQQNDTIQLASTGLNLLQSPQPRTPTQSRTKRTVGAGSYICSPAGFGQRSRCYAN